MEHSLLTLDTQTKAAGLYPVFYYTRTGAIVGLFRQSNDLFFLLVSTSVLLTSVWGVNFLLATNHKLIFLMIILGLDIFLGPDPVG